MQAVELCSWDSVDTLDADTIYSIIPEDLNKTAIDRDAPSLPPTQSGNTNHYIPKFVQRVWPHEWPYVILKPGVI